MLPKRKEFKWTKDSSVFYQHSGDRFRVYTDSAGKAMTIMQMDKNHIKNVLAKINRTDGWRLNWKEVLETELIYRQVYSLK